MKERLATKDGCTTRWNAPLYPGAQRLWRYDLEKHIKRYDCDVSDFGFICRKPTEYFLKEMETELRNLAASDHDYHYMEKEACKIFKKVRDFNDRNKKDD